ncbi:MAG: glycerol acyltransferase [Candidatus Viridilinea halotolerans]|uniref:Glycerol acyltransferase n=1 Tax=Candidatus Viridilinea halotolerans TaxID=2491704 RepID=A0A426U6X0_9CHLR|nr:MAG: glycerol acyltransferase [Candidatus Viridilinea halotolerans]
MSDETVHDPQQPAADAEAPTHETTGPTSAKPSGRKARSKPAGPPAPANEEAVPLSDATAQSDATPPQAPLYGDGSNEEVPIGGAASSLYEAEVEVRNLADQSQGQNAAVGNIAAGVLKLIGDNLRRMTEEQIEKVNVLLRGVDLKDYLDPDFWRGIGMVLQYQIDEQINFVKRRMSGDYTTDAYGMDREMIEVARPFLNFMYRTWWRVSAEGLEHVPADGRALLVGNHSGVLPWDGAMIAVAVGEEHPAKNERIVRCLYLNWFSNLPFVAPALAALGNVPGIPENAVRLLQDDELVCVFPEGVKGVGKLFRDRYQLARFGRGGFVQAAIRAQAPIVPVAVVGAEEIYPMIANATPIARLLGMPYFPITPFFPLLGPAGAIPLPTRWSITFCEPLRTDMYDPSEADDPITILGLSEMVRNTIQTTIDERLAQRTSVF